MADPQIKESLNQLRFKVESMRGIFDVDNLVKDIEKLENEMSADGFWSDPEKAQTVNEERARKKEKIDRWNKINGMVEDAAGMVELADEENDAQTMAEVAGDIASIERDVKAYELETLLSGEYDDCNAIFSIHAGAGGTEAQDWCEMLLRMYTRWFERKKFSVDFIDELQGEEAGLKSVVLEVKGTNAYGLLRSERGIHRLVRISPFDANSRRHTSFSAVEVIPMIEKDIEIDIKDDDIRVDTYRASGAGGQHVNKTSSAIRITHISTNIVVQCQNERSQHKNKEHAMRILKARLFEYERRKQKEKMNEIKGELKDIAWGSQIRSYVFQPYTMVKDLRTRHETGNIIAMMGGELLDDFIWAYLKHEAAGGVLAPVAPDDDE
ncbi:MAG TPA: peptide chain release factor 2 [bacterium]|nr:peptide chain release factor 2 [bacterium]HPN95626.1 peptide chain release factor 2 [bacterium]